ncbi:class I SAM-dependent methyltransferase [Acanthopleuribacter pedis]|uniref:Methyltransferase domain-containing protein n=1 Tax=Acanthopleuribacter pedis TaxID=442870 RepID=A0A8J7U362_9BACT|nr:class I SAM-dependent methyltransferase [Acanthopleuribacter pedis]MBO1317998.1 methyltransferase domain-containing protein [Acanthopleuribacter pedis]
MVKSLVHFVTPLHEGTKRDYVARVTGADKAACAEIAKQWGKEYWDGDRNHGYGGYRYDGRWAKVARLLIDYYGLKDGQRVLDIGCGKGYLLFELKKILPGLDVVGLDISEYAVENGKEEIKDYLQVGDAVSLPFEDDSFDLVISLMTLHNLPIYDLGKALQEMERVKRGDAYLYIESYRNEQEKVNLLYWQLTCESMFSVKEWHWVFENFGYTGDFEFAFFT